MRIRGAEPGPDADDFRARLDDWLVNAPSRSMGRDHLYPFVLPAPVVDKLGFVHQQVTAVRHPG